MFNNTPTVLQNLIFEYLPLDDIYKVQQITDIKYKYLDRECKSRIDDKLRRLKFDPNEFNKKLYESNAVISGSFILQALLGETWPDSDIDIFQFATFYLYKNPNDGDYISAKTSSIERYIYNLMPNEYHVHDTEKLQKKGYDTGNEVIKETIGKVSQIRTIRNYQINGIKIQVINLNTDTFTKAKLDGIWRCINRYRREENDIIKANDILSELNSITEKKDLLYKSIVDSFDFSFLLNMFDGQTVLIKNIDAIMNRQSPNINITDKTHKYMDKENIHVYRALIHYRCQKYISRGFSINNYINTDDKIHIHFFGNYYPAHGYYFNQMDNIYCEKILPYNTNLQFYKLGDQQKLRYICEDLENDEEYNNIFSHHLKIQKSKYEKLFQQNDIGKINMDIEIESDKNDDSDKEGNKVKLKFGGDDTDDTDNSEDDSDEEI